MIRPAIISVLFLSPVAFATGDFVLPQSVQSSSPAAYDVFGSDIAMHAGSLMFVGVRGADAQGANAGAVEIFQRSAGAWSFLERPIATGLAAGDQLGESVAGNASWIIAGASRHDASGADAGAAWVFKKGASNWAFAQKLVPSAGSAGAHFGASVALSTNAMAVGAPTAASGGAVMTFRIVSNAWAPFTTIANPSPMSGDRFGDALAMTDSWLAIGDPFDDTRGTDAGAVHIYVKTPLNWGYSTTLLPVSTAAGQHFGQSVSISGTRLAVGAYGADTGAYESGRADVFDLLSSVWTRTASLTPSYAAFSGNFGWDVSLDSGTLAVGVPGGGAVALAGEVELFTRQSDATWLPVAIGGLAGAEAQDVLGASVATSAGQLVAAAPAAHPSNGYRGRLGAVDLSVDCDGNTIPDIFDLANGAPDCDGDGVQDACEVNSDGDALPNDCDGCPNDPNKTSAGACGCGVADTDSDSDGTPNCNDLCPNDPAKTSPGTCGCGVADTDSDGDGVANCNDGCPTDPAKTSPGTCGCGVADTDSDSDGVANCNDGCPNDPAKLAPGACGCGVADTDSDSDGTPNCNDLCPNDPNKLAPGTCGCGVADTDSDGDGTPNCNDLCPNDPNKLAPGTCGCGVADTDSDSDGTPNCNDGCPTDPAKTSPGTCGCGVADTDSDGDGVANCNDLCPSDPAKTAPGTCGCGVADTDSDGDGVANCNDGCPNDPTQTSAGTCGCGVADTDSDGDGVANCNDGCPNDPAKLAPGACGCGVADTDSDGDGTPNCNDLCPNDPNKLAPGTCGCGVADTDSDSDGVANCNDGCPNDPNKTSAGTCGCGVADTDSDGDGVANCNDGCPNDPAKTSPGTCGCGVADTDSDSDGTPNCNDLCPSDPAKTSPGTCGCGVADTDSDSDGTPNCVDTCPNDPTNQCDLVFEVPTEYATIQAAIDAAPADRASVVLVAAGTFNEGFDLRSKDIVVRGQLNGLTILRGVGLTTSIAKFSGGEPATAGVENLVFRDGTVGSRITPTTAYTVGGAIYGTNSFAFIRHCRFEGCRADYGGAVYLLYGGVTIDGCEFVGNIANIEGGGVQCFSCTGMVRGSVFNLNRCGMNGPGSGSALKFVGANATGDAIFVDECSFTGNIAGVSGSAIEFYENVQGYPGVLHISRTNCANNVSGSPAQTGAAGLRVLGRMESCRLSEGSIFCANLPRNVSGPYFDDGTAGVCDCAADLNADGNVSASDLSLLLSVWGATLTSGVGDVTHNGTVDAGDLAVLLSLWGACDSN